MRKILICSWLFFTIILSQMSHLIADAALPAPNPQFVLSDRIWDLKRFGSYADYKNFLKSQGYTGTDIEIMDREGNFYFYSPTLEKLNWIQQPDLLTDFLKEWNAGGNALTGKKGGGETLSSFRMSAALNFSALARRTDDLEGWFNPSTQKPSAKQAGEILLDLQEHYTFTDLTTEPFSQESQSVIYWGLNATRTKLNLITMSPAFERYLFGSVYYDKGLSKFPDRLVAYDSSHYPMEAGAALPTVGLGDIVFALGRTLDKEVWCGYASDSGFPAYSEHNLLLYRTVQYAPKGYLLFPRGNSSYLYDPKAFNFHADIKKDILEFYELGKISEKRKKPIANLVLSSQAEPDFSLPCFLEPISNALLANGYEIKVTFGQLLDGAELYYVVNSDEWLKNIPFFDALLHLLDYRKSHFYGTVILHPMGEILQSGGWKKIRENFKIPATEKGWVSDLPSSVSVRGRQISWKGSGCGEPSRTLPAQNYGMTFIRDGETRSNSGEVILSKVVENETLALILKSGNHFLINGNFLHLEASWFLSHLMGGALKSPVLAYVTAGRERTAALAIADTTLKIKIPTLETASNWRVVLFNRKGQRIRDDRPPPGEMFEIHLRPYELVILDSRNQGVK